MTTPTPPLTKDTPDLLSKSVDELELSVRSANVLMQSNIKTIGELVWNTEAELLKRKNFGRKSLREIRELLEDLGLSLRGTPFAPPVPPPATLRPITPPQLALNLEALRRKMTASRRMVLSLAHELERLDAVAQLLLADIAKVPPPPLPKAPWEV